MSKLNWWKTSYAVALLCAATAIIAPGQALTTVYSFNQSTIDGVTPEAWALFQGTDGYLYGTASFGGANGRGMIFKIAASGQVTVLHSFDGGDGAGPASGLVQGTDGNFYGTAALGGAISGCSVGDGVGCGTVFRITPRGVLTTLHNFCSQSNCTDGAAPYAALVQGTDGNFYGTTDLGGPSEDGTAFKMTPGGNLTTLYTFCSLGGCEDGYGPNGALVQANDGNLYGTTLLGGALSDRSAECESGCGTIFKITSSGKLTTLYSFCSKNGCADGSEPFGPLVQASDGNFYGTSSFGGANGEYYGTIFKLTPGGALTTLYSFCSQSGCTDGRLPFAGVVQATDGNLYGTTAYGGATDSGTIFKITLSGTLTTFYSFCSQSGCADGSGPLAGLLQATDGNFYGTTSVGGTGSACVGGCGTIFSLSVGLGPFVETLPSGGKVGAAVKILGTNLTGATSVTFNGTPATFTVEASSVIKATVPAGATTGTVQVVTPSGTLSSNVPFRVAP